MKKGSEEASKEMEVFSRSLTSTFTSAIYI